MDIVGKSKEDVSLPKGAPWLSSFSGTGFLDISLSIKRSKCVSLDYPGLLFLHSCRLYCRISGVGF